MRRILLTLALVGLLSTGLSASDNTTAEAPTGQQLTINTRVAILEDRVASLQGDFDTLKIVPSQLARIEEQIKQLNEKSGNNSGILQELGVGLTMAVVTGVLSFIAGKRTKD